MSFGYVVLLAGVAFANYGQIPVPDPAPYNPPVYGPYNPPVIQFPGWYPGHYDSRSDSRSESDSRSDSREDKKCHRCNKLKLFNNPTLFETGNKVASMPNIGYTSEKGKCRKALISCPFNLLNPAMLVVPYKGNAAVLAIPPFTERIATCKKNGRYVAKGIPVNGTGFDNGGLVDVEFSKVACLTPKATPVH